MNNSNSICQITKIVAFSAIFGLLTTTSHGQTSLAQKEVKTISSKLGTPTTDVVDPDLQLMIARAKVLKKAIKRVKPAIVHLEAQKVEKGRTGDKTITEAGSGVLFEYQSKQYILTNLHVVKGSSPSKINVMLDGGRFFKPNSILSDSASDVAVLGVRETTFPVCKFGDSDQVEIGDFVFAVGSPFGLSHSVTYGFVSARGRRNLELGDEDVRFQDFLQTDAAINPGNSGGPLMNLKGEVIGINTAIASNSGGNDGIGFSIPINMALSIGHDLIDYGQVRRAFLGVTLSSEYDFQKATDLGMNRYYGALVTRVGTGSPAQQAGVRINDLILEFNNSEVKDDAHLVNLVSQTMPGNSLPIMVLRNGQKLKLFANIRKRVIAMTAK